jgi:hypothetical protein
LWCIVVFNGLSTVLIAIHAGVIVLGEKLGVNEKPLIRKQQSRGYKSLANDCESIRNTDRTQRKAFTVFDEMIRRLSETVESQSSEPLPDRWSKEFEKKKAKKKQIDIEIGHQLPVSPPTQHTVTRKRSNSAVMRTSATATNLNAFVAKEVGESQSAPAKIFNKLMFCF